MIAKPVEHQHQQFAGRRHSGDIAAPTVSDPLVTIPNRGATAISGHRLNSGMHQFLVIPTGTPTGKHLVESQPDG